MDWTPISTASTAHGRGSESTQSLMGTRLAPVCFLVVSEVSDTRPLVVFSVFLLFVSQYEHLKV